MQKGLLIFSVLLASLASLPGCGGGGGNSGPPQMPPMPVTVLEATPRTVPVTIETVGRLEGAKDIEVRARVSGILTRQHYKEGDSVKAGALLFTIDKAPFEIALAEARATLAQNRAILEQAKREVARLEPLVAEKAVSTKALDDARTAAGTATAAVEASEAKQREAKLNLSYTDVTAPITGVTDRARNSVGTLVTAGTDSSLLTTMHAINTIWVRFSFSEAEAQRMRQAGGKGVVRLVLDGGTAYGHTGTVNFAASTVDTRTGMVQMRAEFPNPEHRLLPGQFARVSVEVGEQDAYLIPQAAIAQTDQGKMAFVVTPDNTVAPRPVEASSWADHDWVVTEGLAAGDKVIIDNLMKLRPGAPVAPHGPDTAPAP